MRGFTWVLGVVGMGLASGCGGGSSDPTPPTVYAVAGSSGMRACDYSCTCENGLTGTFDCDTNACDCSACPSFAPPEPPPFEACGGDPTGVWRLADYKLGPFKLSITSRNGAVTTCLGQRPDATKPKDMYLELKANGDAALLFDFPSDRFDIVDSCVSTADVGCSSLTAYGCVPSDCGICQCTNPAVTSDVSELTWTRDGDKLSLVGKQGANLKFCVDGDSLTFSVEEGGDVTVAERVYRTGQPVVCAERSAEDCTKGGTCTLGQCVGTGSCSEAATEAACAKFQNCAWDAASCYGNVAYHCSLKDFSDGIPGCALSSTPPQCAGTPLKCEVQPGCEAPGCLIGPACRGGQHDCFSDDEGVPGCVCDIGCKGTFDCADVTTEPACKQAGYPVGAFDACTWDTTACVATATPCEQLSIDQCETTLGCFLQAQ